LRKSLRRSGLAAAARRSRPRAQGRLRFRPGDDYKLASHEQLLDYFAKLDASSDRISVERIGKSPRAAT
jgi:hypothetical protein